MLSNYASSLILKEMCGKGGNYGTRIAARAFLALSSTEPNKLGQGVTEPTGGNYARKQIGYYDDTYGQLMGNPVDGVITNSQEIHFNEATANWATEEAPLTYACIYDAAENGNLLAWGLLGKTVDGEWVAQSIVPVANTVVVMKVGDVKISLT